MDRLIALSRGLPVHAVVMASRLVARGTWD
jgi:hypothetical protein